MKTLIPSSSARRSLPLLGAAIGLATLAGCGETSANAPLPAARVEAIAGTSLSGPAGAPLPDPVLVRVFGTDEQPLPGATVTFSAANGGSVDPASATSDGNGVASTRWTLGQTAGTQVLTATAGTGITTTINATVTAGRPASVNAVAGNSQTAAAGSAVPIPPGVRVIDEFGNLVAGALVSFSVLSGGGSVTNGLRQTNAQGIATVGSWILGSTPGTQSLAARVEAAGVDNNPVVFTATATTPTGSQLVLTAGNNQTAPVGRLVPIAPTVTVRNNAGDGVPGVTVNFEVTAGGGSVVGSRQITDATGIATVAGWFLGPLPGANSLRASVTGLTPVTFNATGVAGAPVSMTAASLTTQSAPAGTNVADPPKVVVRDVSGTPVAGVVVTFAVTAGGGTITGSPATTNALGIAGLQTWKLGSALGPNTVVASAPGLPSVTFNATAAAGVPATIVATAGINQIAVAGTVVPENPTVKVTDANGNPVVGAAVTFVVISGGGSATGVNAVTDLQGLAVVGSWTLGTAAIAPNTLRATVTGSGVTGNPVTFTAQSASKIVIIAPFPASTINQATDFMINVQLQNSLGAVVPLAGVNLTIAITSGGGTLNGTLSHATAPNGTAVFNQINVTGGAGARTFTITGPGLLTAATIAITFN